MSDGIERDGFKPGDVVVITGAGGGFGRAFCQRFGAMGAKIAAWDVNEKLGEETVRLVRDAGGDITFFKADLSRREDVAAAIDGTLAKVGAPYCIINNASIYPRAPTVDMSADAFELAMRVNIMAPFLIVKAFGPKMMENKRGVIINISSGTRHRRRGGRRRLRLEQGRHPQLHEDDRHGMGEVQHPLQFHRARRVLHRATAGGDRSAGIAGARTPADTVGTRRLSRRHGGARGVSRQLGRRLHDRTGHRHERRARHDFLNRTHKGAARKEAASNGRTSEWSRKPCSPGPSHL